MWVPAVIGVGIAVAFWLLTSRRRESVRRQGAWLYPGQEFASPEQAAAYVERNAPAIAASGDERQVALALNALADVRPDSPAVSLLTGGENVSGIPWGGRVFPHPMEWKQHIIRRYGPLMVQMVAAYNANDSDTVGALYVDLWDLLEGEHENAHRLWTVNDRYLAWSGVAEKQLLADAASAEIPGRVAEKTGG